MNDSINRLWKQLTSSRLAGIGAIVGVVAISGIGLGLLSLGQAADRDARVENPIAQATQIEANFDSSPQVPLILEVAASEPEWRTGLKYRTELGTNNGMLFIFPSARQRTFWMQDTYIPLDIIFLNADLQVINIAEFTAPNQTEETYSSTAPAQYVVEVNGGWTAQHDLQPGDSLEIIIPE